MIEHFLLLYIIFPFFPWTKRWFLHAKRGREMPMPRLPKGQGEGPCTESRLWVVRIGPKWSKKCGRRVNHVFQGFQWSKICGSMYLFRNFHGQGLIRSVFLGVEHHTELGSKHQRPAHRSMDGWSWTHCKKNTITRI